ncbi:MAG: deoxyribonuclease IV [Oligosphaeraceae bacterium]
MKYIGPHLSIAGGVALSAARAKECGATGFALFTKNQRQWKAPAIPPQEAESFRNACAEGGYPPEAILPHDSYLINLGNPDPDKCQAAREAFAEELRRVEALGLSMLNFHPGSGLGAPREETLRRIAQGIQQALDQTERAVAVVENTAGQGTLAGKDLEELQKIVEWVDRPGRIGVCIDTCHAYAAGIDLSTPQGLDAFWTEFQERLGFELLRGMHWNDTKSGLGSHLDRHAPLGEGHLGWETFLTLARDPRLEGIPLILETPEPERWPEETRRLLEAARETP